MKRFLCYTLLIPTLSMNLLASSPIEDGFDDQDSNRDGVLSGREVGILKALDEDGDGEVSRSEFQVAVDQQRQRASTMVNGLFSERDKNEDNRLSGSEIVGLEHCDKNGDGRITEQELISGFSIDAPALQGKTFAEITTIAEDGFAKVDANDDGRLTGSEISGSSHFDLNADGRVSKLEYVIGTVLSAQPQGTDGNSPTANPASSDQVETIVSEVISAMNNSDQASVVHQRMHEKLQQITDLCILEYAFQHAQGSHGEFKQPGKGQVKQTKLENGAIQVEVNVPCPQGKMALSMQVLRGQITALGLVSPEMNMLDQALFKDLQQERMQNHFAKVYGREVEVLINTIVKGDDETALQMIHPSVIQQIGREPFENVCQKLRTKIDPIDSMEIETFAANKGEKDIYTFTVTYLVKSKSNAVLFGCTFQRAGLCAVMTGMSIENFPDAKSLLRKDDNVPPAPTPKPMPKNAIADAAWIETVSIGDGVKFKLPGKTNRVEQKDGKAVRWDIQLPKKKVLFKMEVDTYDFEIARTGRVFFDSYRTRLLKNESRTLETVRSEPKSGFPAQLLAIRNEDSTYTVTLQILAANKLYTANCELPDESNEYQLLAKQFFDSIVLIDGSGANRVGPQQTNEDGVAPATPATGEPLTPVAPPAPVDPVAPPAPR